MNGTGTKAVAGRKKRTMSAAARRKISLAQKARWGKAEGNTEADHPSGGQKANRGSAEGAVGEDEERRDDSRVTVAHQKRMHRHNSGVSFCLPSLPALRS